MAERWYALARWDDTDADEVDAHGRQPGWYPPQGTVGLFDMRPSSATEYGFFALDHEPTADDWLGTDTPDLHVLNDGTDLSEYHMDASELDRWKSLLGIDTDSTCSLSSSDVETLEDALIWTFERCGDPEHAQRFKPPTATTAGNIELHLGGHSLISRTPFARLPKAARDRTLAVVQKDMGRLLDLCRMSAGEARRRRIVRPPGDHYRRVATRMMWKYPTVQDWRGLFPRGRRAEAEPPLPPHTSYQETFTDTDNTNLQNHTSDSGFPWTHVANNTCFILSNTLTADGSGGNGRYRHEADLSSDDHKAAADALATSSNNGVLEVMTRFSPTSHDYYGAHAYDGVDLNLRRVDAGSHTHLWSGSYPSSFPFHMAMLSDGTSHQILIDGSSRTTQSDSTHSGFLRGGIGPRYEGDEMDNWAFEDLSAGVVGAPADLSHGQGLTSPGISQVHIISPNPLAHSHTIEQPTIAQTHVEAPADLSHGHTVDEPVIAQVHISTPQDLQHGHVLESPATGATITGSPADLAHGHSLAEPGVAQTHIASPAELRHGHALGVPTVAVIYHGDPADLQHSHTIESIVQYVAGTLDAELKVKHMLSGEVKVIHVLEADLEVE